MKKQAMTLTFLEILCLAIQRQDEICRDAIEKIKMAKKQGAEFSEYIEEMYSERFWKMRKMLEIYEVNTGKEYGYDFDYLN